MSVAQAQSAYDLLAARLGQLTGYVPPREGLNWRCPAHDDRNPSLSVTRSAAGVLLKCHAGCETSAILAALDLSPSALFDNPRSHGSREPVAIYPYVDEAGDLLFEVVRLEGKQFRQRRPDPSAPSGYKWSLQGVRRVPYRLPRVLEAAKAGGTIWVAEGEKDVHALESAGAVATCNPGGAGKWLPGFSEYLRGAGEIVIVTDHDQPGAKHALGVLKACKAARLKCRIVQAAEGKDAADHLAAGLGLEDFVPVEERALRAEVAGVELRLLEGGRGEGGGAELNGHGGSGGGPAPDGFTVPVASGQPWVVQDAVLYRWVGSGDDAHLEEIERLPRVVRHLVRRSRGGSITSRSFVLEHPSGATLHLRSTALADEESWSGWPSSLIMEPRVRHARSYAIRKLAEAVPEVDERWGWHDGELIAPPEGVGPEGFGEVVPGDEANHAAWREVLTIGAGHPRFALAAGAGLGGLFVEPMGRARFVLALVTAASSEGKSTAQFVAAGSLGYPGQSPLAPDGAFLTLDAAPGGLASMIGGLGCLPAILDEGGASGWTADQWNAFVMRYATSGGKRVRGTRNPDEFTRGSGHDSLVLLSSNTDGVANERNDGTRPRFIIVRGPILAPANSAEAARDARDVATLVASAYGHPLALVRSGAVPLGEVRRLFSEVDGRLGSRPGVAGRLALSLAVPVVGACILARLYGVPAFGEAALRAAFEVLDEAEEEGAELAESPGERFIRLVEERIVARPAAFPTRDMLLAEQGRDLYDGDGRLIESPARLPLKDREGFRLDEGVLVLTQSAQALMTDAGLPRLQVLRELKAKGLLRANSDREHPFRFNTDVVTIGHVHGYFLKKTGWTGWTPPADEQTPSSPALSGPAGLPDGDVIDPVGAPKTGWTPDNALTRENASTPAGPAGPAGFLGHELHVADAQDDAPAVGAPDLTTESGEDDPDEGLVRELLARAEALPEGDLQGLRRYVAANGWAPDSLAHWQLEQLLRMVEALERGQRRSEPLPAEPVPGTPPRPPARARRPEPREQPAGLYVPMVTDGHRLYAPEPEDVEGGIVGVLGGAATRAGDAKAVLWATRSGMEALGLPPSPRKAVAWLGEQGLSAVALGETVKVEHARGTVLLHAVGAGWGEDFREDFVADDPAELLACLALVREHLGLELAYSAANLMQAALLRAPRRVRLGAAPTEPTLEPAVLPTAWSNPEPTWCLAPERWPAGAYLRAFDRNAAYLRSMRDVTLPDGECAEVGPFQLEVMSEGKRQAGYYLVDIGLLVGALEAHGLPNPFARLGSESTRNWLTAPLVTLAAELADEFAVRLEVERAFLAGEQHAFLRSVAERFAKAYVALKADGSPRAKAVLGVLKGAYAATTMRFEADALRKAREGTEHLGPLARPVWRWTITDKHAAGTFRALRAAGAVAWLNTDCGLFVVDGAEQVPEGLVLGHEPGRWKPAGGAVQREEARRLLAESGPRAVLEAATERSEA